MLISSPECMNSELLEELMSSEGESWSLLFAVRGRKTTVCAFTLPRASRPQPWPPLGSALAVPPVPAWDAESQALPGTGLVWSNPQGLLVAPQRSGVGASWLLVGAPSLVTSRGLLFPQCSLPCSASPLPLEITTTSITWMRAKASVTSSTCLSSTSESSAWPRASHTQTVL